MALLLNEEHVRALLPMPRLVDVMERALIDYSSGHVEQPVRSVVDVGVDHNFFGVMPASMPGALGAKLVTFFISNASRGLPTHFATVVLLHPETGELQCILDGRYLTEARTAAVSAVSAKWLARSGAKNLAIIGCGVQAHSHYEALTHVIPFQRVTVWGRNPEKLAAFCDGKSVQPAVSIKEAVSEADVVALVTAAREPIVFDAWIRPGTHLIAVGACRPNHRELEGRLVARSRFVVDSRAGALKEAGDLLLAIEEGLIGPDHIAAELGERPQRMSETEVTVFKSLGMAVEDVAAARMAFDLARAAGIGFEFRF